MRGAVPEARRGSGLSVAHLQRWTPAEVGGWLQRVHLGQFAELFKEHNIGGDVLLDITAEDLIDMGVTKVGDRLRLLRALEVLQNQAKAREGPQLDVAVLGSSPLVQINRGSSPLTLEPIDLQREQERLCSMVRKYTNESARAITIGTFEALSWVLQLGTMVLAVTAHVTAQGRLLLERQTGEAAEFDPAVALPEMLGPGQSGTGSPSSGGGAIPVCVVLSLSGGGLMEAARAFLRHGARHVVAVARAPGAECDGFARTFCAVFHRALLGGSTVADAFAFASSAAHRKASVGGQGSILSKGGPRGDGAEAQFTLLPEGVPDRHEVALFPASLLGVGTSGVSHGEAGDAECGEEGSDDGGSADSGVAASSKGGENCTAPGSFTSTVPESAVSAESSADGAIGCVAHTRCLRPEGRIVGRQRDIWQVVLALAKSRCVVVCGVGGVGKAVLCRSVAAHLQQRGHRHCEKGVHTVRLRGIRTVHAAEAQLRNAMEEGGVQVTVGAGTSGAIVDDWEAVAANLGERLLVLTNAEELLNADAAGLARFVDWLLASGPRLHVLVTSRRTVPAEAWPGRSHQLPFHVYLRQLEPGASKQLLLDFAPALDPELVEQIAGLCGHLPFAMKLVGQRLGARGDPLTAAHEFIAETTTSPEKRASMLFSECVAPYVWRALDSTRRAALAALSLFRGAFETAAAAVVLNVNIERASVLLREFQDQCLIERPSESLFYMPTSVHLLVHQQVTGAGMESGSEIDLVGATERLVLHFMAVLRDVACATAADRGRGGAGLEALRAFDRHRVDIDLALVVAGTSDLFVVMTQLGRDVFDTRLSAQRRVEIYERLLGVLMAARKAPTNPADATMGAGIVRLLRAFEPSSAKEAVAGGGAQPTLVKTRSLPLRGGLPGPVLAPRTQPTTPVAKGLAATFDEEDAGSPSFLSKSLPASPQHNPAGPAPTGFAMGPAPPLPGGVVGDAGGAYADDNPGELAPRHGRRRALARRQASAQPLGCLDSLEQEKLAPPSAQEAERSVSPRSPSRSSRAASAPLLPAAVVRARIGVDEPDDAVRRAPSYLFAASDCDGEGQQHYCGSSAGEDVAEGGGPDREGVMAFRPAWCPVLDAGQNARFRALLDGVIQGSPRQWASPSPSAASGARASQHGPEGARTGSGSGGGNAGRGRDYPRAGGSSGVASPSDGHHGGAVGSRTPAAVASPSAKWGPSIWWHKEPEHDSVLIEVLLRLGAAHSSLGRFAHAAQLLRKALIRAEELAQRSGQYGGLSAEAMRAELLGTLSSVLCQQGLIDESEAMLWQARQLAKHAGHAELYVKLTCDLAEFNRKYKGNIKAAQRLFQLGLEMRMKTLGLEHIDTASTLNAVGVFAAQKGDLEEARRLITDAIRIRIKLLGRMHLSVAEAYHNLGTVQESLQNHADAARLYEAALQVKRHVLPQNHMSIADTENHLSALYSKMNKHEDCIRLLRDCLAQCLRTVGEVHTSTASVLVNLGHALHTVASESYNTMPLAAFLAQLDESQVLLERALEIRRRLFRKRHPCIAECRAGLGYVHFKKQEFTNAERHFAAALRICRRNYGSLHPDVSLWSLWLGKTQLQQQRFAKGRDNLRMALRVAEKLAARGGSGGGHTPLSATHMEEVRHLLKGLDSPTSRGITRSSPAAVLTPKQIAATALDSSPCGQDTTASEAPSDSMAEPAAEPPSKSSPEDTKRAPDMIPALAGRQRPRPPCLKSPSLSPSPSLSDSDTGLSGDLGRGGAVVSFGNGLVQRAPGMLGPGSPPAVAGSAASLRSPLNSPSSQSASTSSSNAEDEDTSDDRTSQIEADCAGAKPRKLPTYNLLMRYVRRSTQEYESSQRTRT